MPSCGASCSLIAAPMDPTGDTLDAISSAPIVELELRDRRRATGLSPSPPGQRSRVLIGDYSRCICHLAVAGLGKRLLLSVANIVQRFGNRQIWPQRTERNRGYRESMARVQTTKSRVRTARLGKFARLHCKRPGLMCRCVQTTKTRRRHSSMTFKSRHEGVIARASLTNRVNGVVRPRMRRIHILPELTEPRISQTLRAELHWQVVQPRFRPFRSSRSTRTNIASITPLHSIQSCAHSSTGQNDIDTRYFTLLYIDYILLQLLFLDDPDTPTPIDSGQRLQRL